MIGAAMFIVSTVIVVVTCLFGFAILCWAWRFALSVAIGFITFVTCILMEVQGINIISFAAMAFMFPWLALHALKERNEKKESASWLLSLSS